MIKIKYRDYKSIFQEMNIYTTNSEYTRFIDDDFLFVNEGTEIEPYCAFLVGSNLYSMNTCSYSWSNLPCEVKIGRYCSIAANLSFLSVRHPYECLTSSSITYDESFPIMNKIFKEPLKKIHLDIPNKITHIQDDVWIGANVTLKSGLTIGTGSIIAANSVVVKDVMPYSIYGGNPAQFIKHRFDLEIISRLLISRWWLYDPNILFHRYDFTNPVNFLNKFEKEKNDIDYYFPKKLIF